MPIYKSVLEKLQGIGKVDMFGPRATNGISAKRPLLVKVKARNNVNTFDTTSDVRTAISVRNNRRMGDVIIAPYVDYTVVTASLSSKVVTFSGTVDPTMIKKDQWLMVGYQKMRVDSVSGNDVTMTTTWGDGTPHVTDVIAGSPRTLVSGLRYSEFLQALHKSRSTDLSRASLVQAALPFWPGLGSTRPQRRRCRVLRL